MLVNVWVFLTWVYAGINGNESDLGKKLLVLVSVVKFSIDGKVYIEVYGRIGGWGVLVSSLL